ncbi:MAG: histidine kinase N-terminal 7TM domain-containing protein [Anaerolineae bacterium]
MNFWDLGLHVSLLFVSALIAGVLVRVAWRRRPAAGATAIAVLMLAVGEWSLATIGELLASGLAAKFFWIKVEFIGVVVIPLAWLAFTLAYTGASAWLTPRRFAFMALIPLLTLVLVWTNDLHHLVYAAYRLDTSRDLALVNPTYGVWFWVYIAYTYLFLIVGTLMVWRGVYRSPSIYRGQAAAIIMAAGLPWLTNLIYVLNLSPWPNLDPTPVSLTLTGLAVILSLYRYRLLDLAPVARDELLENMIDGVLVLDLHDRVVDINRTALSMMQHTEREVIGQPMLRFLGGQPGLVARYRTVMETHEEITLGSGLNQRFFDLRISPLKDRRGHTTGRLVFLRNISERKRVEHLLSQSEQRYQTLVENVPIGVFRCTLGQQGSLLMANRAFLAMCGLDEAEIERAAMTSLLAAPAAWAQIADRVAAQGRVEGAEAQLRRPDGSRIWISLTATPAIFGGDAGAAGAPAGLDCTAQDISDSKQRTLEREAILAISESVRAAPTRAAMLPVILEQMMALVDAEGATLVLRDPVSTELVVEAAGGRWEGAGGERALGSDSVTAAVMARQEPYLAAAGVHAWPLPGAVQATPLAVACMPLLVDADAIGALWAGRPHAFGEGDVRILTAVANIAASAIQRTSLYEEVQRYAGELEQRVAARTAELQAANEGLKELDRLKTKFVSNVSHELRMPLANIKLYLNLLSREREEHWQRNLQVIARETHVLSQLIEDLLDLSRLDMGKTPLALGPMNLNDLVEDLVEQRAGLLEERGLQLRAELDEALPLALGDRQMLMQVATNLMANAMNYTPSGGQVMMRTWVQRETEQIWVVLTVSDTGCGMSEEDQRRLFERFYRGEAARQTQAPGSGLGLAICQEIVERHGGRISVASAVGQGSTFSVRLRPAAAAGGGWAELA